MTPTRGKPANGRPPSTVIPVTLLIATTAPPTLAGTITPKTADADLIFRALIAVCSILLAQAIIPVVKAWLQKRKLRTTYRNYLLAHVTNTLESFQGAGSTHFAEKHLTDYNNTDWFEYLKEHSLGIPQIFLDIEAVIKKTLETESYIPSVSYFGLEGNLLDHTSPIWELDGPESTAALQYFLTQQQIETSLDYQYNGWYFDLIKSNKQDRTRWCEGLNNVLFDMAQHYKVARELKKVLEALV